MKHVPIVAISDNKLAFAVGTLFTNLIAVKHKTTFYDFFAVLGPDVSPENIDKIKQVQEMHPDDCSVSVIQMDSRFDKIPNGTKHISNACAYKMCLGEILPNLDKVIYLDTDILVFDDLADLYDTEMDDAYIAGVQSIEHYLTHRDLISKLYIPDLTYYVNAGVMVMNLQKIRDDKIEPKLQALIGTYDDSVDQHIFNRVCYGHIKLLPQQYNVFQSSEWLYNSPSVLIGMTQSELNTVKERPVIYHYTDRFKPWSYFNLKYQLIWFRHYKNSPFCDVDLSFQYFEHSPCTFSVSFDTKKKRVQWYKKVFSVNKKNIDGKKHTVICLFGHNFVI